MPYIYYRNLIGPGKVPMPGSQCPPPHPRTAGLVWEHWSVWDIIHEVGDLVKVALPSTEFTDTNKQEG